MKILCVTSLLWLRNVFKAFKKKRNTFGVLTSSTCVASVNLWRNYNYNSIRRNVDVMLARVTCAYYVSFAYKNGYVTHKLWTRAILAKLTYYLSCITKQKLNIWHPMFHMIVYDTQRLLLI